MKSVFIVCDDKRTLFVLCISIKKIKIKYMCSTVDILPTENGIKNRICVHGAKQLYVVNVTS